MSDSPDATIIGHVEGLWGKQIAYRIEGPEAGYPVVLVAGWPQTLHAWRHVQPLLAAKGLRTIAIDPPGLGASDVLEAGTKYTTSLIANHLSAAIDRLKIGDFVLVGHDIGAWICYAWAATRPEGIERVVLLDAGVPGAMGTGFPFEKAAGIFQFYFNAVPDLPERLTEGRERVYLEWLFASKTKIEGAITASDIDEYMLCYGQPERMSAGFEYYRAVAASSTLLADASPLGMPTLAIGGEFALGHSMGEALKDRCAELTRTVIPNVGHFLPEEAPEAVAKQIFDFNAGARGMIEKRNLGAHVTN